MAAGVHAVDLDLARQIRAAMNDSAERFAKFVGEHESRLVLAVEIAAELQGAVALGAIRKDRDGEEVVANRKFAIGEDGPRRHAELIPTSRAFPELASSVGVNLHAAAFGAARFAAIIGPADRGELGVRFLIRHTRNGAQTERPCGCGEKEVLRHATKSRDLHHGIS